MRTQEERIRQLHIRASEIQRQADRKKTAGFGGFCIGVFVLLLISMIRVNSLLQNVMNVDMQGSSLLNESTGGYVIAAITAFFAGVIITAVIFRYRKNKK